MTVEQENVIDFVAVAPQTADVTLVISDHLDWHNINEHLLLLQEKLNAYLRFVEDGELKAKFPHISDRSSSIEVVLKYDVPPDALWFFDRARAALATAGIVFAYRHTPV